MWKVVETKARETGVAKIERRRSKRGDRKEVRRKGKGKKAKPEKNRKRRRQ